MSFRGQDIKGLFYPWAFVLKEGKKIARNRLDYSLMLLQVGRAEVLKSPKKLSKQLEKTRAEVGETHGL